MLSKLANLILLVFLSSSLSTQEKTIYCKHYESNWRYANGAYNGLGTAENGDIYYVLNSAMLKVGCQLYKFVPETEEVIHLGDITEPFIEKGQKMVPQGKSHNRLMDHKGKVYFGTHTDHYDRSGSKESHGALPEGWDMYPGGWIVSYDKETGEYEKYYTAPEHDGILTTAIDRKRDRIYGITWPHGHTFYVDLKTGKSKELGKFARDGEVGKGDRYLRLSRAMVVDPADGSVYFTNALGELYRYDLEDDRVHKMQDSLRRDCMGALDLHSAGRWTFGYGWRQALWSERDSCIYAMHMDSEYLIRLNPRTGRVTLIDRIASQARLSNGNWPSYVGSLGFTLGNDGHTLYYFSGTPTENPVMRPPVSEFSDERIVTHWNGDYHLITYDLRDGTYTDHGAIMFEDGSQPVHLNSMTIGKDGTIYTLAFINRDNKPYCELISMPDPLKKE